MSDDDILVEEVLQEYGMTRERWKKVKADRDWETHQRDLFLQGSGLLMGKAKTRDEHDADKIDKVWPCNSDCFCRPEMILSTINEITYSRR